MQSKPRSHIYWALGHCLAASGQRASHVLPQSRRVVARELGSIYCCNVMCSCVASRNMPAVARCSDSDSSRPYFCMAGRSGRISSPSCRMRLQTRRRFHWLPECIRGFAADAQTRTVQSQDKKKMFPSREQSVPTTYLNLPSTTPISQHDDKSMYRPAGMPL